MNTGNMLGLGLVWNSFNENKYRVTSYTAYLRETSKPNLTIRTDSPVEKIILEDDRAVAVKLRDGGKSRIITFQFCGVHFKLIMVAL